MIVNSILSRNYIRVGFAIIIGLIGAQIFAFAGFPLPWLLGSIFFCLVAAILGIPVKGPGKSVLPMRVVLGVAIGSSFTLDLFQRLGEFLGSLIVVVPVTFAIFFIGFFYFRYIARFDVTTSTYSAMPGGMADMLTLGAAAGADARVLSLIHATRVLLIVFTLPFGFQFLGGLKSQGLSLSYISIFDQPFIDLATLALIGGLGWWAASAAHISGAAIIGPMLLSAVCHLSGLTAAGPPIELVNLAQLVIGCQVGCLFTDFTFKQIVRVVWLSLGLSICTLLLACGVAYGVATILGFDLKAAILAFSPGGQAEMILVAIGLGVDLPYVALHHITRMIIVIGFASLVHRWMVKWWS